MSNSKKRRENLKKVQDRTFYTSRCIQGYSWARFFVFVGGRGRGKSTDIQRFLVKQWREKGTEFTWLRLTDAEIKKLKQDNAKDAFEAVVKERYPELNNLKMKGDNLYADGKLLCRFKSLSTYGSDKGTALYDCKDDGWSYVLLDEMNKVDGARSSGNTVHQLKNMVETLLRTKNKKIKVFMIGNLEDALGSILPGAFNFIPLDGAFGIYKLRKRKTVIHYFDDSEAFKLKKAESTSNLIGSNHSTFTNKIILDKSLLKNKVRLVAPFRRIMFTKDVSFTLWLGQDGSTIITEYNGENVPVTAMRPHLDQVYVADRRNEIKDRYFKKGYYYHNLITQELFKQAMKDLK